MRITLRPAQPDDYAFVRGLYLETMRWIIETLFGWDEAEQSARFARQFELEASRIIQADGRDAGWLQVREAPDSIHVGQLFILPALQRRGIGTRVLTGLMDEARGKAKPVMLSVVKINPALRLYDRLGFRRIDEDAHKVHMRWDAWGA